MKLTEKMEWLKSEPSKEEIRSELQSFLDGLPDGPEMTLADLRTARVLQYIIERD